VPREAQSAQSSRPFDCPWQITMEYTIKGATYDEARAKADKLEKAARRLGMPEPFTEEDPIDRLDEIERTRGA
jgi:hypothetical protein